MRATGGTNAKLPSPRWELQRNRACAVSAPVSVTAHLTRSLSPLIAPSREFRLCARSDHRPPIASIRPRVHYLFLRCLRPAPRCVTWCSGKTTRARRAWMRRSGDTQPESIDCGSGGGEVRRHRAGGSACRAVDRHLCDRVRRFLNPGGAARRRTPGATSSGRSACGA